jgi:Glyoxalase-like domain
VSNSLFAVTSDRADALAAVLARFWTDVLGRRVAEDPQVPEPETVKNRLHLDVISDTFDAETERLLGLGARRLRDVERHEVRWMTFADIEGNEFDLIAG